MCDVDLPCGKDVSSFFISVLCGVGMLLCGSCTGEVGALICFAPQSSRVIFQEAFGCVAMFTLFYNWCVFFYKFEKKMCFRSNKKKEHVCKFLRIILN